MKQYRPILFSFLLLALCLTAACAWDNPSPAPGDASSSSAGEPGESSAVAVSDAIPFSLSGGMKRRVSIARAVLAPGPLLVLDEPFTGLDQNTKKVVLDYLKRYTQGRTLLLVTHDPAERDALAHSTLQMPSQII